LRVCNPYRPEATDTIELARVSGCERIEVPGSVLLFQREVEDFVAAALDGRTQRITLAESRRTVATLSALYRSARDARACAIL
jgi:predicted dehydrogenase